MRTGSGMGMSVPFEELSPWAQVMTIVNTIVGGLQRLGTIGALLSLPILVVALPVMFVVWPLIRLAGWLVGLPFRLLASAVPRRGDNQGPPSRASVTTVEVSPSTSVRSRSEPSRKTQQPHEETVTHRLTEAKALLDQGLITAAEYEQKRAEILKSL